VKRGDLSNSGRNIEEILFYKREGPTGRPADGGEDAHRRWRGCAPAAERLRTGGVERTPPAIEEKLFMRRRKQER
jgi:hypothetical protein